MTEIRSTAWIAMGGNSLGPERTAHQIFVKAVKSLSESGLAVCAVSRFFKTPCFPAGMGPDYVNATVGVKTVLEPRQVLEILHRVEAEFGRMRVERWGQRTLDLDLLAYDSQVAPDLPVLQNWISLPLDQQVRRTPDQMVLPHPRLQDRAFVLVPWAEIAPDWVHPVLGRTVRALRDDLPIDDLEEVAPL